MCASDTILSRSSVHNFNEIKKKKKKNMRLTDPTRSGGFAATSKLRPVKQKNTVKLQQHGARGINSRVK